MNLPLRGRRRDGPLQGVAIALVLLALLPSAAAAHAELETSSPADGATVPSPFDGPIVLDFSAALADGSKAELIGPIGPVAIQTVVGPGATMTITPAGPLDPGTYEVRWTSVAEDTDVARGTIAFTVEAAPELTPTPAVEPTTTATPAGTTAPASASPSAGPSASPLPAPTDPGTATSSTDVLIPIVVVVLVAAAGAAYFLTRRNRPTTPR